MRPLLFPALWFAALAATGAAAFPTPPALDAALRAAAPGQVIELPFSSTGTIRLLNPATNRLTVSGGTLLYSDDPETTATTGVLYRDTLPAGMQRVYLYHVNDRTTATRFSIIVENVGAATALVTPTRFSFPAPTTNYLHAGREGVRLFYENTVLPPALTLAPGERGLLAPALDATAVSRNQLAAAIIEVESSQPLRVATVMVDTGVNTLTAYPNLEVAPNDGLNRQGTFPGFHRASPTAPYVWTTSEGIVRLRVADFGFGASDPPAAGTDAERGGVATELRGNYGVTYDVTVAATNPTGQRAAVLVNPRGGNYGGYFRTTLQGEAPRAQMVPSASLVVPPTTSAGVIALLDLPRGTRTVRLEFIPAGASSLPIEILFVPFGDPAPLPSAWVIGGT